MFPLKTIIRLGNIPAPNRFGAQRKHDIHTGLDLFAKTDSPVYAIEDGTIIGIIPFTGPKAGTDWWLDTEAVVVSGNSGVVLYGEILHSNELKVGTEVLEGECLGTVMQVLKNDKNKPTSMLHIEWYEDDKAFSKYDEWDSWKEIGTKPPGLKNIEELLYNSKK